MFTPSNGPALQAWEVEIGKAIVRFADIELAVVKCLEIVPEEAMGETAARLPFGQRADLLIEILEGRKTLSSELATILDCVRKARGFSNTRNLVAHNPVMLDIYAQEEQEGEMELHDFTEHTIRSVRGGNAKLTLEGLKGFAAEVDKTAVTLWTAIMRHTGTAEHIWRQYPWEERPCK